MNVFDQRRRSFLFSLGGLGMSQVLMQGIIEAQAAARQGYTLGATEGEHLIHLRNHGNIFIKVGSATGSDNLALGTPYCPNIRSLRKQSGLQTGGILIWRALLQSPRVLLWRNAFSNQSFSAAADFRRW